MSDALKTKLQKERNQKEYAGTIFTEKEQNSIKKLNDIQWPTIGEFTVEKATEKINEFIKNVIYNIYIARCFLLNLMFVFKL